MSVLLSESSSLSNQNHKGADKVLSGYLIKDGHTSCAGYEVMHDLCKDACLMHRRAFNLDHMKFVNEKEKLQSTTIGDKKKKSLINTKLSIFIQLAFWLHEK